MHDDTFQPLVAEAPPREREHQSPPHRILLGHRNLAAIVIAAVLVGFALATEFNYYKLSKGDKNDQVHKVAVHANSFDIILPDDDDDDDTDDLVWPRVAWLMSFPNSGTSFTLKMIRHVSQNLAASNYGEENKDEFGNSIPVYANDTNGPFWIDPHRRSANNYGHPETYVLTKTHCGGRCHKCGPSGYAESPHSFLLACLSGKRAYMNTMSGIPEYEEVTYNSNIVYKAVHLIRNPFDNVVSRFHLEQHNYRKKNETEKLAMFPSSREGFRAFCRMLDEKYAREEEGSRFVDPKVLEIMKNVPCHADFFRFVQWHNLAFITTEDLDLPTYVLHYENYDTRFMDTVAELVSFLRLEWRGDITEFIKGKEYSDYFDNDEREAVKVALEELASRMTWNNIRHYFD